jgi:hypothetical protein
MNASISPLDAEWAFEVATAVMNNNLDRHSAGELVRKIGELLKGRAREAPYHSINEFYDMVRNKPLPAFEKAYLDVKEQISRLGLTFS